MRINRLRLLIANAFGAFSRTLPVPVRSAFIAVATFSARRPRWLATLAIIALHTVALFTLAIIPPPRIPETPIFIDVSLIPGDGIAFPSVPAAKTSATESTAEAATSDEMETLPSKTNSLEALDSLERTEDQVAQSTSSTETSPAEEAKPPQLADASTPSEDVLALVEKMTGADASVLSQVDPTLPSSSESMSDNRRAQPTQAGGCAIDAMLKDRIMTDSAMQTALAAVPSADRSVSNAIQLWDGDWISVPLSPEASDPLVAIQVFTVAVVDAAPARCRNQPMFGPRFVVLALENGMEVVLVIGSGEWRWRDVLPPRQPTLFRWLGL